jgi:hypothetical protein
MTQSETVELALQRQQCEFDLDQFVELLIHAAHAAWKDQERHNRREASLYLRQGDILEAAVADLKKLLHHPNSAIRAKRMRTLHEALGSAAVIARHGIEDPVADRLHERLHTTPGRRQKAHDDQLRADTLDRLVAKVRQEKEHQSKSDWGIAEEVATRASKLPDLISRESISKEGVHAWMKRTGKLKD